MPKGKKNARRKPGVFVLIMQRNPFKCRVRLKLYFGCLLKSHAYRSSKPHFASAVGYFIVVVLISHSCRN